MKRAIGIIRVSATRGREGESFHSPETQLDRIRDHCKREGWELLDHHKELDVSGTKPLAQRPGLSRAIAAVEAREADVIVVAYFDRLVRSVKVQAEIVDRVERAGGNVLTLDAGQITNGKAATKLQANMLGAVAQYVADNTRDKVAEAQERAVGLGIAPWPNTPPGYLRGPDKRYVPDPRLAPAVLRAFEMRASGATINTIRHFLAEHGVRMTYSGVYKLLSQRAYLGEIHFGALVNLAAHEPIVDHDLFARVQAIVVPRDYQGESDLLLARQALLYCTCGSRLVANVVRRPYGTYHVYRCKAPDCAVRCSITASIVEARVIDEARALLDQLLGTSSRHNGVRNAKAALTTAEDGLARVVRLLAAAGVEDEPSAVEAVQSARDARNAAQRAYADAAAANRATQLAVTADDVFDHGTIEEKRELIRAVIKRVTVARGKGPERVTVEGNVLKNEETRR